MSKRKSRLIEILVDLGLLAPDDGARVLVELEDAEPGVLTGDLIVERGYASREAVDKALTVQRELGHPELLVQTVTAANQCAEDARASIMSLGEVARAIARKS